MDFKFDLQRFWRDSEDVTYRGNRRWSGNWGRIWVDGDMVFEIQSFELKVIADRDDVIIGQSVDKKITSLTGEGEIVIKKVFDRGYNALLENWKAGHDVRVTLVGSLKDPDALHEGETRIEVENVVFDEIPILHFAKGEVVEDTLPIHFTPEDLRYTNTVER
ncbi:MAG: terminase [Selenomonadaceae bacterium]|nr:terminase [Selenomonadaceae bacterium]